MSLIPLSDPDIAVIRRQYIKDLYVPPVPNVSVAEALSHYNAANRKNFISDDDLKAKAVNVGRAYREEIGGVYDEEMGKQLVGGADETTADTEAMGMQKDAFFRLIRASVLEDMMIDPGFCGSITDNDQRSALFKTWKEQILKDRQFTKNRTTAPFRSIALERY